MNRDMVWTENFPSNSIKKDIIGMRKVIPLAKVIINLQIPWKNEPGGWLVVAKSDDCK